MKLLIVTQAVDKDDFVLGFFHRWIEECAKHCETIEVIALRTGKYSFPSNVHVVSLGKEEGNGRLARVYRFYAYVFSLRKKYDTVLVHMNPEYIVLAGVLWKLMRKRIGLWYVHKSVTVKLRIAVALCDKVFSASKDSFRLETPKLYIVGHGIDTTFFTPMFREKRKKGEIRLLSAGRISFAKHHDMILRALALLPDGAHLTIAGAPATGADRGYENKLHVLARELKIESRVLFVGPVTQECMRELYSSTDVFMHASSTGSYDKVVLEALACGVPVLTTSEAFADGKLPVVLTEASPEALATGVGGILASKVDTEALAKVVRENHSIEHCMTTVLELLKTPQVA
jgi:glycosyltransferase involved in cell wall biosynthesis